jgi:cytochrome b pre-mRNA-processing protein 3
MDRSLREMGVGDLSVGKKVRKMAEVFYGRVAAYDLALGGAEGALEAAIARNVFPDGPEEEAGPRRLSAHVMEQRAHLALQDTGAIAGGVIHFKEPSP